MNIKDEHDNVVTLDPTKRAIKTLNEVEVVDGYTVRCYHHSIVINGSTKKVTCKKCGDELDAFEVLLKQAKRSANIVFAIEHVKKETIELEKELKKLKAKRNYLKSKIREIEGT